MGNSFCLAVCGATCTRPPVTACPDPPISQYRRHSYVLETSEPPCLPKKERKSNMPEYHGGATPT